MASDIDEIILVGGSTRMPQVQQKLEMVYGKPISFFEPDLAVAKGAALVADGVNVESENTDGEEASGTPASGGRRASLGGNSGSMMINDIEVEEACTKSYGLAAQDKGKEIIGNIVFKDTVKPAHEEREFGTSCANQTSINLRVYENESLEADATVDESRQMYESCEVMLTSGLPEGSPIKIIFDLDGNGELIITAIDLTNNIPTTVKPFRIGNEAASVGMDAAKNARLA